MRHRRFWILGMVALVALAAVAARSWVTVDETQFVLDTEFGRPVALHDDQPGETSLHLKYP